jgi:hypothetical protein
MKLTLLIDQLIRQNPELVNQPAYLMLEVWDRQGLRLHPQQRNMILNGEVASTESIARAARKVKIKYKAEREQIRLRYARLTRR